MVLILQIISGHQLLLFYNYGLQLKIQFLIVLFYQIFFSQAFSMVQEMMVLVFLIFNRIISYSLFLFIFFPHMLEVIKLNSSKLLSIVSYMKLTILELKQQRIQFFKVSFFKIFDFYPPQYFTASNFFRIKFSERQSNEQFLKSFIQFFACHMRSQLMLDLSQLFCFQTIIIINIGGLKASLRRMNMLEKEKNLIFQCNQAIQGVGQEIKEVYLCSCGKDYRSFAAVYLHVRIKHGIKLSTTALEHRKRMFIQNDIRKIYYDVNVEPKEKIIPLNSAFTHRTRAKNYQRNDQENLAGLLGSKWINSITECFDQYLIEFQRPKHLYQKLKVFLAREFENTHKRIPIKKIPQYINDFVQRFLPSCDDPIKRETQKWHETCEQLFCFCKWLREKRYTEYFVFLEFSPIQN